MVAVIKPVKNILNPLNYNEEKVKEKAATFIGAQGYPKDHDQLSFNQKYNRLKHLAELNTNVSSSCIHISLNFHPDDFPEPKKELPESEKRIIEETQALKLNNIADAFMQKIGFGDQPYLVYRHFDSAHPHVHVLTSKIRANGKRIETQNIGKNEAFKASRELELAFGLTPALGQQTIEKYSIKPIVVEKVRYGRKQTKRAMTNVLAAVLDKYKYGSLPELNAILGLYNIVADRGAPDSYLYKQQGLYYRLLNEHNEKVGVPIKASDFYMKPTLAYLQNKFVQNLGNRSKEKRKLGNTLHLELLGKPTSFDSFCSNLQKKGIHVVPRYTKTGEIFGLTFVDHNTKSVFNGRDISKAYSAKSILDEIDRNNEKIQLDPIKPLPAETLAPVKEIETDSLPSWQELLNENFPGDTLLEDLVEILFHTEYTNPNLPYPLRAKKKRKKKK